MQSYLPENFREVVAAAALLVGFVFAFISLAKDQKEHTLRITGIFSLLGLCLFSNNPSTYFAAVFIIATAVTQLEFLQNLAAIIRGSKDYFDFMSKYSSQTPSEVVEGVKQEVEEIEQAVQELAQESETDEMSENQPNELDKQSYSADKDVSQTKVIKVDESKKIGAVKETTKSKVQFAIIVEEYALKYLERKYQRHIGRKVRLRGTNLEFDGVMQNGSATVIFEVKTTVRGHLPLSVLRNSITKMVRNISESYNNYVILTYVIVGNVCISEQMRIKALKKEFSYSNLGIEFEFYTIEEIGLKEILIEN